MIGYLGFLNTPGTFAKECMIRTGAPTSLPSFNTIGMIYALCYLVFNVDTAVFLVRRSFAEDSMLKQEFGKEWDEWARNVRWNVIPYVA